MDLLFYIYQDFVEEKRMLRWLQAFAKFDQNMIVNQIN